MAKIKEIEWQMLSPGILSRLASYRVFKQCDAVEKDQIRIIVSGGYGKTSWEYFKLDETGLIIESPRGMAKDFNKKVRITNMDNMVEQYKGKIINQF